MKIDQKYFGVFLAVIALIAAILIAVFTVNNRQGEKQSFKESMFSQDSLQKVYWPSLETSDSVQIADFQGQFVVVDFWSNWTGISQKSHQKLAELKKEYPDTLQVIAASVGLQEQEVVSYIQEQNLQFYFAEGSKHFSDFNVPGLPAQLVYGSNGTLQSIFMGYSDESQYDSLRSMLNEEAN